MKEERNIITMDGQGNISLPSDIGATAMTEWEICEPFGAAKVRRALLDMWKSHSTLTLLATQNYPFLLKYDCPLWLK